MATSPFEEVDVSGCDCIEYAVPFREMASKEQPSRTSPYLFGGFLLFWLVAVVCSYVV